MQLEVAYLDATLVEALEGSVRIVNVDAPQTEVRTTLVTDSASDFPPAYVVQLEEELLPGSEYRIEALGCEPVFTEVDGLPTTVNEATPRTLATFEAGAPQPLPNATPTLQATASRRQRIRLAGGAACVFEADAAVVEVSLTPTDELEAWRELLRYRVYVDGAPWSDTTTDRQVFGGAMEPASGLAGTRIFLDCDEATGRQPRVDEGRHQVEIEVLLPGEDLGLRSEPLEIDLRCAATTDETSPGCHVSATRVAGPRWPAIAWLIAALALGGRRRGGPRATAPR